MIGVIFYIKGERKEEELVVLQHLSQAAWNPIQGGTLLNPFD